jgi:hypothetical protein
VLLFLKKGKVVDKPQKCKFFKSMVTFLGKIVTTEGLSIQTSHVPEISKIEKPANIKDIQRFLGLVNYVSPFHQIC